MLVSAHLKNSNQIEGKTCKTKETHAKQTQHTCKTCINKRNTHAKHAKTKETHMQNMQNERNTHAKHAKTKLKQMQKVKKKRTCETLKIAIHMLEKDFGRSEKNTHAKNITKQEIEASFHHSVSNVSSSCQAHNKGCK